MAWLAFPLAWKAFRIFRGNFQTFEQIIPAQPLTIQTLMTLALLLLAVI